MCEWEKVQATERAIVGFWEIDLVIDINVGSLNPVIKITDDRIEIINNCGCEVEFSRGLFVSLGGHLAGTYIEGAGDV